jgi:hypothetical protein
VFGISKIKRNIQKKKLTHRLKKIRYLAPQAQGSVFFFIQTVG